MSQPEPPYELRVTGPAQRQLERLPEGTAAAIVEFMLSALVDNPYRVGGRLQRELAGLHSARRGSYRVVYEINDDAASCRRAAHRSSLTRLPTSLTRPRQKERDTAGQRDGVVEAGAPRFSSACMRASSWFGRRCP